jgi:hypothetical protein
MALTADTPLAEFLGLVTPRWQREYGRCVPTIPPIAKFKRGQESNRPPVVEVDEVMRVRSRWWTVKRLEKINGIPGSQLMDVALQECAMCPVQHRCCAHAIDNEEYDVWSCTEADRRFMVEEVPEWRDELRSAREAGETVQAMVVRLKQARSNR